jgi:hypothetical protein
MRVGAFKLAGSFAARGARQGSDRTADIPAGSDAPFKIRAAVSGNPG